MAERPMADAGPSSGFYNSQKGRLHYLEWGDPAMPPIVLLHGSRDHARSWDHLAARLSRRWRVIAPDLRGHGDSDWSGEGVYVWLSFVYDLAELLEQLNLPPARFVAHSLGGQVALQFAGLYPERVAGLVVVEGVGVMKRHPPSPERCRTWIDAHRASGRHTPSRYPTAEDAGARLLIANPRLSSEQVRHLTVHGVERNEDGSVSWKYDPALKSMLPLWTGEEEDCTRFAAIDCPVLLVRGREGWATDPAETGILACFSDARSLTFDGAGHWPHHDRVEPFTEAVLAFLASTDERSE